MVKYLRIASVIEGFSWLYLIYCSVYLKRMLGIEEAIKAPGMVHGLLFSVFSILLYLCWKSKEWKLGDTAKLFIASLIPFGFLWIEKKLKGIK